MHHGTDRVMRLLEQNPEYDVVEYGCLGNCGQCFTQPYAMVNGEIVAADTAEELLELIERKIAELDDPWSDLDF